MYVFNEQEDLIDDFKNKLNKDFIVLPFQGPKSNGMPELHKLNPIPMYYKTEDKNSTHTDGRMSGAGKPSIIHVVPEAKEGGLLSKIKSGD